MDVGDVAGDDERRIGHDGTAATVAGQELVDDDDVMLRGDGLLLVGERVAGAGHVGGAVRGLEHVDVQCFDARARPRLVEGRVALRDRIAASGDDAVREFERGGFGEAVLADVAEADERRIKSGLRVGRNCGACGGDPNVAGAVGVRERLREGHILAVLLLAHELLSLT